MARLDSDEKRANGKASKSRANGKSASCASKSAKSASKLTESALREAALGYLDRQDGSVEQVRRALKRRVARFAEVGTESEPLEAVERVLARLVEAKILDDARFALGFAQGQRRRGASTVYLRQKLRTRGLSAEHVELAIESTHNSEQYNELESAAIYARKRRLKEKFDLNDPVARNKALAALARRGFSFDVARRVLDV